MLERREGGEDGGGGSQRDLEAAGDYLPESSGSDKDFNLAIKKKTNQ